MVRINFRYEVFNTKVGNTNALKQFVHGCILSSLLLIFVDFSSRFKDLRFNYHQVRTTTSTIRMICDFDTILRVRCTKNRMNLCVGENTSESVASRAGSGEPRVTPSEAATPRQGFVGLASFVIKNSLKV